MIIAPLLSSLVLALLSLCFRRDLVWVRWISIIGSLIVLGLSVSVFWTVLNSGPERLQVGSWAFPYGIAFSVDTLSAVLIMISALMGFCGILASQAVLSAQQEMRGFYIFYHFLMMAVYGAFSTGDLFNLYVWFEVLLLASFSLVAISRSRFSLGGDYKYAVLSILGSFFFLFGIALVYSAAGTLDFKDLAVTLREGYQSQGIQLGSLFLLLAFALKAGLVPFHFWLPASYPSTMAPAAAIFSGLLTKVGLYAIARVLLAPLMSHEPWMWEALRMAALASMVIGVLGAFSRYKLQSILSFHIVSQVGYIALAFSLGTQGAIVAGIFYLIHHIVVKTNLFFSATYLQQLAHEQDVRQIGNKIDVAWFPTLLFAISALSLVGVPPLSGFWAKLLTVQAAIQLRDWWALLICLVVSLFTLMSMLKIWSEVFWKPAFSSPVQTEIRKAHYIFIPLVILNIWTIGVGLGSTTVREVSERIYRELHLQEEVKNETPL